jgi:protein SCO1/2
VKLADKVKRICCGVVALLAGIMVSSASDAAAVDHEKRPVGVVLDPLLSLTSHDGRSVTRASLRRRPFIVLFGYTNCADVCPASLFNMSSLLGALGDDGDRLPVLFVTVDPERDTPEQLKTYLGSFDSRIIGLSGSREQIAAVTAAFAAPFDRGSETGGTSHPSQVFLMDKYGMLARAIDYTAPEQIEATAKRLLQQ